MWSARGRNAWSARVRYLAELFIFGMTLLKALVSVEYFFVRILFASRAGLSQAQVSVQVLLELRFRHR